MAAPAATVATSTRAARVGPESSGLDMATIANELGRQAAGAGIAPGRCPSWPRAADAETRRHGDTAIRALAARTRCVLLRRCHVSLRVTILALLAGLLFSTIAPIAGVTFFSTSQAIGELEGTHFLVVSAAATREIESLLEPARSLLAESRT